MLSIDSIKGWKIKGLSIGWILLVVVDKFFLDIAGFDAGEDWLTQILLALGVFSARDTVQTVTGK